MSSSEITISKAAAVEELLQFCLVYLRVRNLAELRVSKFSLAANKSLKIEALILGLAKRC